MGGAFSVLHDAYRTALFAFTKLIRMNAEFQSVLERINTGPVLPQPRTTSSFWFTEPPFPELVDVQSPQLPSSADIVIVGSGITGAAVAWTIQREARRKGQEKRVVVVEARQLTSGATGRNGGHIKPPLYQAFAEVKQNLGVETAVELIRFWRMHLDCLRELCMAENFEAAECREVETADLAIDEMEFKKAKVEVEELQKYMPEVEIKVWEGDEAREHFKVGKHVCGVISYQAGAIWPYRLVTSIWNNLTSDLASAVTIETSTPVDSIDAEGLGDHPFRVHTPRGIIAATHVVHATNAFAAHLIPGLKGRMTGLRGYATAQHPGSLFPGAQGKRSWSIIYRGGFDYMTQRPGESPNGGQLILGGGFARAQNNGLGEIGVWTDDVTDPFTDAHLGGVLPAVFGQENWGEDSKDGRLVQGWSGVMAFTPDMLPYVGKLDPRTTGRHIGSKSKASTPQSNIAPGEWIAGGYCGDGMVNAWLSGVAVALMIMGEDEDVPKSPGIPGGRPVDWLPKAFKPDYHRIKSSSMLDFISHL